MVTEGTATQNRICLRKGLTSGILGNVGNDHTEDNLLRVIASKFGLEFPFPECVHRIDDQMLVTEWHYLMPAATKLGQQYKEIERLDLHIMPWFPELAEYYFLKRFNVLFPSHKEDNIV